MAKTIAQAYLDVSLRLPVEDIKVKQRLDRAYEIVNGHGYAIDVMEYHVTIEGTSIEGTSTVYCVNKASTSLFTDTSASYTVTNKQCTCPDFETARSNLCKHRLAIMLIEEMQC